MTQFIFNVSSKNPCVPGSIPGPGTTNTLIYINLSSCKILHLQGLFV